MYKKIIFILLLCSIKSFAQTKEYEEMFGQWQRVDTLSWFPEVLTIGTDGYFVWTAEGDPGTIYTQFGKWSVNQDTLTLYCKLLLHDEFGNGKYLKKYCNDNFLKYIFFLNSEKLYLLGFYTIMNNKRKFIDYNKRTGKTLDENYLYFFNRAKFTCPKSRE